MSDNNPYDALLETVLANIEAGRSTTLDVNVSLSAMRKGMRAALIRKQDMDAATAELMGLETKPFSCTIKNLSINEDPYAKSAYGKNGRVVVVTNGGGSNKFATKFEFQVLDKLAQERPEDDNDTSDWP